MGRLCTRVPIYNTFGTSSIIFALLYLIMVSIEPVNTNNLQEVALFLKKSDLVYRHLDWHTPTEWLEYPAFLVLREDYQLSALISCAPEINEAAWIRVFASKHHRDYEEDFISLVNSASFILNEKHVNELACLVLNDWIEPILISAGFNSEIAVVTLIWKELPINNLLISNSDLIIRKMMQRDLETVNLLDNTAFPPLWQNSLPSINKSYNLSSYNTVALIKGEIVGYQISTISFDGAHIARLATRCDFKRQGIATTLLSNLIAHFQDLGMMKITVNTQSNNLASLNLYKKLGFLQTGDKIKVYTKML